MRRLGSQSPERPWRLTGLAVLVLLGVGVAIGASSNQVRDIVAKRIVFEDESGVRRAVLGIDEDGMAAMKLCDAEGNVRLALDVSEEGPGIVLYDDHGNHRAWMSTASDGPSLMLYDEQGQHRVVVHAGESGPALTLYDGQGQYRAWLHVRPNGQDLVLKDDQGKTISQLAKAGRNVMDAQLPVLSPISARTEEHPTSWHVAPAPAPPSRQSHEPAEAAPVVPSGKQEWSPGSLFRPWFHKQR